MHVVTIVVNLSGIPIQNISCYMDPSVKLLAGLFQYRLNKPILQY